MESPPQLRPTRPSFWRFSLRELLLLKLVIAAFLGWGRGIYQRHKPFVVAGSIRVILIPSGDEARLLVFVEEDRFR